MKAICAPVFTTRSLSKGVFDVSLRILFADDSMTAQNMGKKILSEAGYDVVAVSNGAAAVKKIAEQKPDIIILDVYMPGYSGLEVCEKVRGSLETLKIPVLLTVGKMEPYKPEDATRVKADGVIVKPFEASDLLAIIKKFEERLGPKRAASAPEQTLRLERPWEDAHHAADSSSKLPNATVETPPASSLHVQESAVQQSETIASPVVDVPDHMAAISAFPDLLAPDPVPSPAESLTPAMNSFSSTPTVAPQAQNQAAPAS